MLLGQIVYSKMMTQLFTKIFDCILSRSVTNVGITRVSTHDRCQHSRCQYLVCRR